MDLKEDLRIQPKNVFILSSSGKPVFAKCGDESELITIFGLLQAVVSIVADSGDEIHSVKAGNRRILFLVKKSLYFVIVSSTGEPDAILQTMLEFMYSQILMILTSKVHDVLRSNSSKDIRDLLGPETEYILRASCSSDITPYHIAFHGVKSCCIAHDLRSSINSYLRTCVAKSNSALGIILSEDVLVSYCPNSESSLVLETSDVMLLTHFVGNSTSFRSHEQNWVPICLPNFNASAFLQAYVSFIRLPTGYGDGLQLLIVLVAMETDPSTFKLIHNERLILESELINRNLIDPLTVCIQQSSSIVNQIKRQHMCLHYVYKYRPNNMTNNNSGASSSGVSSNGNTEGALPSQCLCSEFDETLSNLSVQRKIWSIYQQFAVYARTGSSSLPPSTVIHSPNSMASIMSLSPSADHSLNYIILDCGYVIVSLSSADSELYATFPSSINPLDACIYSNRLNKLMNSESSNYFCT